jgi:ligand-binding sensor domain-containing protein
MAQKTGEPAKRNGIEFEHISIKEGLSQGSFNCILQDNKGFMWFGTQNGLNRYDGHEFKPYTLDTDNPKVLSGMSLIFDLIRFPGIG